MPYIQNNVGHGPLYTNIESGKKLRNFTNQQDQYYPKITSISSIKIKYKGGKILNLWTF